MHSRFVIEQVIESQRHRLLQMDTGLERQVTGFQQLTSHAFILTGIRRCGKSTVLQQINKTLHEGSIYLNFEDPRLAGFDIGDFNRLHDAASQQGLSTYFFDEIQTVPQWENFVRFRLDEGYRIFITGSNASMLSRELGTKLTGRHISKELFPFSYLEFLEFTGKTKGEGSLSTYLSGGGFPEFVKSGQEEILMQSFNDIIIRDIAIRYNIRNTSALRQLAVWLVSNVAKPITGNSLRKIFAIGSSSTMMEYLGYFADAYLFFFVPRFSYSNKVQVVNPRKIYCIDNGIINANSVSFTPDVSRLLENLVFLNLRHQNDEIYYFNEGKECDFIVFKNGKIGRILQVCHQLDQQNTDREIGGLMEAMNFFDFKEGVIVTYNQTDRFVIDGRTINVMPFYAWVGPGG